MLRSKRVYLSPLREEDSSLLFTWINDRELALFNAGYTPVQPFQHQMWFEAIQKRGDVFIFGIRLLTGNKLIGSCQLHSINLVHRTAELQIRIGDVSARAQGYGSESIGLLLQFAFNDLNLNRVSLHVFETNTIAMHVYSKTGFSHEGLLRQAAYINGQFINIIIMSILQEEYQANDDYRNTSA